MAEVSIRMFEGLISKHIVRAGTDNRNLLLEERG